MSKVFCIYKNIAIIYLPLSIYLFIPFEKLITADKTTWISLKAESLFVNSIYGFQKILNFLFSTTFEITGCKLENVAFTN